MPDVLASKVLLLLQRRGMTISMLARRAGVHRNVLSRWLAGESSISVAKVISIGRVLGVALAFTELSNGHTNGTSLHRHAGPAAAPAPRRRPEP